jgi:PAS domain S-box-containing protein
VNQAFLKLTGWTLEEVVGRAPEEIELWESPEALHAAEKRLIESGGFRDVEVQLRTKRGEGVACLASAETVILNEETCVLSVLQDITERKRSEAELVAAIDAAMRDTSSLTRSIMDKLAGMRAPAGGGRTAEDELTDREREVLQLLCSGRNDQAIAEALGVSRNTVRNHVARIYAKIGVHSRSEAVIWARDRGYNSKA